MDRLERLRALIDVAERRSFSAAARARRTSPAAMSRAVAALERDLGVALLRRTTRHVSLTPEGLLSWRNAGTQSKGSTMPRG